MLDLQDIAFREALYWPPSTGMLVLMIGALFTLQGFRFARFLLAGSVAMVGFLGGGAAATLADLPPIVGGWAGAAVLGVLALVNFRVGVYLSAIATFCALAMYLAARAELTPDGRLVAGAVGVVIGAVSPYAFGRTAPIIITSLQGGMLLIVGFVGLTSSWAPSLALTFVEWSSQVFFMSPLLLTMGFVLGFSVQTNMQQGDISTGGTFGDLHHEEH